MEAMEYVWPSSDDQLVDAVSPRLPGASDDTSDLLAYLILGYKNAGDRLIDVMAGGETIDGVMIYPAIFLYRHCLELQMKFILDYHGRSAGVTANWKSHRLDVLWEELAPVLEHFGIDTSREADMAVQKNIMAFARMDPDAMLFRYPLDKKNRTLADQHIDPENFKRVIDGIHNYFQGTIAMMDELTSAGP